MTLLLTSLLLFDHSFQYTEGKLVTLGFMAFHPIPGKQLKLVKSCVYGQIASVLVSVLWMTQDSSHFQECLSRMENTHGEKM